MKMSKGMKKDADKFLIQPGMSFQEGISGTNAVNLAISLEKSVYILPHHHYCDFLRKWYCYSTPINYKGKLSGCLALFIAGHPIKTELIAITELIAYQIATELRNISKESPCCQPNIKLNDRQITLLKLLAMGLTDKAIAMEMNLNIGTISYHKTNMYKILEAECSTQAVVKALKFNIISIDQIEL
ncbi:helix-turn-helix domain-containing protein [Ruminiclostridium josui]|uniref:helix-turn-helix domain-containing protein n=1 Tax=Ruminiclostridium josui TaxID=1499 RepID=UPI0004AF4DC3|nr:LuxR C-terminal-related transcriptional regulator [Ruminiclostridium josui]